MKITKTFSLEPVLRDGVWYVEWSAVDANFPGTEDNKVRARWSRYAKKHSAGKDAFGRYYNTKRHATGTIRGFNELEKMRIAPRGAEYVKEG